MTLAIAQLFLMTSHLTVGSFSSAPAARSRPSTETSHASSSKWHTHRRVVSAVSYCIFYARLLLKSLAAGDSSYVMLDAGEGCWFQLRKFAAHSPSSFASGGKHYCITFLLCHTNRCNYQIQRGSRHMRMCCTMSHRACTLCGSRTPTPTTTWASWRLLGTGTRCWLRGERPYLLCS